MIICGFPCIGKTTWSKREKSKIVDLESSYFKLDGRDNTGWEENYCKLAMHIEQAGFIVFVSTHPLVQEYLLKHNAKAIAMFPELELKDLWVERSKFRYEKSGSEKDLRAYERIRDHFEEDIKSLMDSKMKKAIISGSNPHDDAYTRIKVNEFPQEILEEFEKMLSDIKG